MLELVVSSAFKSEVKKIKNSKDKAELKLVLEYYYLSKYWLQNIKTIVLAASIKTIANVM